MGRVKAIHREMRVPQGEGKANERDRFTARHLHH